MAKGSDPALSDRRAQGPGVRGALARDATLTMALILISRLLGFVRERAVAEVFGRTAETDAFKAAFNIPDLMYFLLVGGAITAAFIPVFTGYLARGQEQEGWRVASTFLNGTVLALVLLTVAGMAFAPQLAPLVAYAFTGRQRELLIELMRWMFPAVFFTALAGLGIGVLNSYRRFSLPLVGPILYNACIIASAYVLGPRMGIRGMAVGTAVGAALNAALQWSQVGVRYWRWQPVMDLRHEGVRRLYRIMAPALFGLSITQLSLIISTSLASTLPEGSITALGLANRVMQFPLGIFAMGMSTVTYPAMAAHVALGEMKRFGAMVTAALRGVLFFTVPSAVGLGVLAEPVVRVLFEAGQFSVRDSRATAWALYFYSGALVFQSAIQILTRAFYSLQDTRTPVRISTLALVLNAVLSLAFLRWTAMGHAGLALAFTLVSFVNFCLYLAVLHRRKAGVHLAGLLGFLAKVGAASVLVGLAAHVSAAHTAASIGTDTLAERSLVLAAGVAAGASVYAGATWMMGLDEALLAATALRRVGQRIRQRTGATAGRLRRLLGRLAGAGGVRP